ncbi:MAG: hypothetical protein IJU46_06180 [Clostridia bacterium]|nr:hypothetical protein [Clostridia bacterium]
MKKKREGSVAAGGERRIIALWGPHGSGKTLLAARLAASLASVPGVQVSVLLCDRTVPALPVLFPEARERELPSVGAALSAADIDEETVLSSAVVCRKCPDLLFFGYTVGENGFSYPSFSEGRATLFIRRLSLLCDYLIADCVPEAQSDPLSSAAMKCADSVIRLYCPDMASFAFYDSQLPLYAGDVWCAENHLRVQNQTTGEIYLPVDESRSHMTRCAVSVPFSRQLKFAASGGDLLTAPAGRAFDSALSKLEKALHSEGSLSLSDATDGGGRPADADAGLDGTDPGTEVGYGGGNVF